MKKYSFIFSWILALCLAFVANIALAQGPPQGKKKKEKTEQADERGKKGKARKHQAKEGNQGRGKAYGKHKGEMSGREFGATRAAEARAKNQKKRAMARGKIGTSEAKRVEAGREISRTKAEANGKMSRKEISKRKAAIKKAEAKLTKAEKKISRGKKKVKEQ